MSEDDNKNAEHLVHIKIILGLIAGVVIAIGLKYFGHW